MKLRYYLAALSLILVLGAVTWSTVFAQTGTTSSDTQIGVVITESDRLNMRNGPGVQYDLVLKLEPGTVVTVVDSTVDGTWVQVQPEESELIGWVSSEYIAIEGALTAVEDPTESPEQPATETATVIDPVQLLIPTATPIALATTTPAPTEMLVPVEPANEAESSLLETESTRPSNVGQLFPRTWARAAGEDDVTDLDNTVQRAATVAEQDEAAETVKNAKPTLAAQELDLSASEPSVSPTTEPELVAPSAVSTGSPKAVTTPVSMNVRGGPGTNYGVIDTVPSGTELEIVGLSPGNTWLQVKLPDRDEPAWIYSVLAEIVGSLDDVPRLTEDELPEPPQSSSTEQQSVASAAVAAAPAPAGAGFFGYGIQAHMLGGQSGQALNAVSDMGFDWVKQQVQWYLFEPQPGARGFGELSQIVSEAGNRNINVLFSVVNAPDWAREDGFDGSVGGPPADPQTYANFVGAMAGQFCGTSLKAIEVWNEQNLHYEWGNKPLNPAEYMDLLRPAYASIKAACPQMLVISGALTPAADAGALAKDDFAYLEEMYKNGLASYADGIGAHPSGYNVPADVRWEQACATIQTTGNSFNGACDTPHHSWSFLSTMEGYRNIMNVYGDSSKRIWPTEFGWAAGGALDPRYMYANDNSFDEQAKWTVDAYQMMKSWGWVGPAFLWNLNFRVVADGTEKAQWGIVGNDYSPLPTYSALKAMPK